MWDLIVSVPDHCLSFYIGYTQVNRVFRCRRLPDFGGKQSGLGVTGSVFINFISHTSTARGQKTK